MKMPMELVQDACLEVSAKGYHEPYEEIKLAALSPRRETACSR